MQPEARPNVQQTKKRPSDLDLLLCQATHLEPQDKVDRTAGGTHGTAKGLHGGVATIIGDDELATDGAADEDSDGADTKEQTCSQTDLPDRADLGNKRRDEAEDGTGGEAEEDGEADDGGDAARGEPQGEDQDGIDDGEGDQDGETADLVGDVVGHGTTESAGSVEDGDQVEGQGVRHATGSGLDDQKGKRQEHAEHGQKRAERQ